MGNGMDLAQLIGEYMSSKTPLAACEYCLGTLGERIRSRQLSRRGLWTELEEDSVQAVRVLGLRGAVESLLMPRLERLPGYRRIRGSGWSGGAA